MWLQLHTKTCFKCSLYKNLQANRWSAPNQPGGAALQVAGLSLDSGAQLLKRSDLHPKRCIFFGDSITEGVEAQCHPDPSCTGGGDLCGQCQQHSLISMHWLDSHFHGSKFSGKPDDAFRSLSSYVAAFVALSMCYLHDVSVCKFLVLLLAHSCSLLPVTVLIQTTRQRRRGGGQ